MRKDDLKDGAFTELFTAIAELRSGSEVRKFMRDLCTLAELRAMAERWEIVRYLKRGVPYRAIAEQTGASTATITRVAQWLNNGMGGYKLALARQHRSLGKTVKMKTIA